MVGHLSFSLSEVTLPSEKCEGHTAHLTLRWCLAFPCGESAPSFQHSARLVIERCAKLSVLSLFAIIVPSHLFVQDRVFLALAALVLELTL